MSEQSPRPGSRTAPTGYRLTTSFPYLVRRVGLRIGELFDRAVAAHGVNVSMYRVMAALVEGDGQQLGRLSDVTAIELSTLSRLVGTMVTKGLLTRRRPRDNGRIVEISLSSRGRRLVEELMPIAAHFESMATNGLGEADVARLKFQLRTAYDNLAKLEAELAGPAKPGALAKPRRKRTASRATTVAT